MNTSAVSFPALFSIKQDEFLKQFPEAKQAIVEGRNPLQGTIISIPDGLKVEDVQFSELSGITVTIHVYFEAATVHTIKIVPTTPVDDGVEWLNGIVQTVGEAPLNELMFEEKTDVSFLGHRAEAMLGEVPSLTVYQE